MLGPVGAATNSLATAVGLKTQMKHGKVVGALTGAATGAALFAAAKSLAWYFAICAEIAWDTLSRAYVDTCQLTSALSLAQYLTPRAHRARHKPSA